MRVYLCHFAGEEEEAGREVWHGQVMYTNSARVHRLQLRTDKPPSLQELDSHVIMYWLQKTAQHVYTTELCIILKFLYSSCRLWHLKIICLPAFMVTQLISFNRYYVFNNYF